MKGQYNYQCASTFPPEFKNENRTYDSLKYLLFGVCVQLSEFIGGGYTGTFGMKHEAKTKT